MAFEQVRVLQANLGAGNLAVDGDLGPKTLQALIDYIATNAPEGAGAALHKAISGSAPWNRLRLIYLLANVQVECDFLLVEENLNYSALRICEVWPSRFKTPAAAQGCARNPEALANAVYGGRMGNTTPGDGWRFRGRGWPQLTGRDAYTIVGGVAGKDFVGNPDQLLTLDGSAAAATGFFAWKKVGQLADADDLVGVRTRWNGGGHGLPGFRTTVALLKDVWPA